MFDAAAGIVLFAIGIVVVAMVLVYLFVAIARSRRGP